MNTDVLAKIELFRSPQGDLCANVITPGHDFGGGRLEDGMMRFATNDALPPGDQRDANDLFRVLALMQRVAFGVATRVVHSDVWIRRN